MHSVWECACNWHLNPFKHLLCLLHVCYIELSDVFTRVARTHTLAFTSAMDRSVVRNSTSFQSMAMHVCVSLHFPGPEMRPRRQRSSISPEHVFSVQPVLVHCRKWTSLSLMCNGATQLSRHSTKSASIKCESERVKKTRKMLHDWIYQWLIEPNIFRYSLFPANIWSFRTPFYGALRNDVASSSFSAAIQFSSILQSGKCIMFSIYWCSFSSQSSLQSMYGMCGLMGRSVRTQF